jgi:hypothetical protein
MANPLRPSSDFRHTKTIPSGQRRKDLNVLRSERVRFCRPSNPRALNPRNQFHKVELLTPSCRARAAATSSNRVSLEPESKENVGFCPASCAALNLSSGSMARRRSSGLQGRARLAAAPLLAADREIELERSATRSTSLVLGSLPAALRRCNRPESRGHSYVHALQRPPGDPYAPFGAVVHLQPDSDRAGIASLRPENLLAFPWARLSRSVRLKRAAAEHAVQMNRRAALAERAG